MTVTETSVIAYHSITNLGVLRNQQEQITHFLRYNKTHNPHWNFSRKEISRRLDLEVSSVAGRVNELVKSGVVVEDKKRRCFYSKRLVTTVRLK